MLDNPKISYERKKDKFSDFVIKETINDLEEIQKTIQNIENQYKDFHKCLNQLIKYPEECSKNLKNKIVNILNWFKNEKNLTKSEFSEHHKALKDIFNTYYSSISKIYSNKFIENISTLNKNLKDTIDNLTQFDPSNSDESIINFENNLTYSYYENSSFRKLDQFYGENSSKFNNKEIETTLNCNFCSSSNVYYYCNHCNQILCRECGDHIIIYQEKNQLLKNIEKHTLELLTQVKADNEENKKEFFKSFINVFKTYTFKCSYIMKNENINYVDKETFKKFQYPSIINEDNLENVKKFLEEINELEKIIREKIDLNNSIQNREISLLLKKEIKREFNIINTISDIESNYNENDDENDEKNNSFVEEKLKVGEDDDEEEEEEEKNIKNNSKFLLYIINKYNTFLNDNFNEKIKEKIINALGINKNNISISSNNKILFINDFIKTTDFSNLSPRDIRTKFQGLKILYDYKLLIDGFIRHKCKIPEYYINYKYNFIIPNLTLTNNRNNEIYNPPYGWLGIALNVERIYDGDYTWLNKNSRQWAICYYGFDFGKHLNTNQICDLLKEIILKKNLPKDNFNIKLNSDDRRNRGKKVGPGYSLTPYIDIAEKYSGIISLGNKKYKIVLMAKVSIKNIKEPDDGTLWVMQNEKYIRIYKILFKEVINKRRKIIN